MGSNHKTRESSCPSNAPRLIRKSHSVCNIRNHRRLLPSYCISLLQQEKKIKDLFKDGSIKETMGHLIRKFIFYESVTPHKASSHHFKNMIINVQQADNH